MLSKKISLLGLALILIGCGAYYVYDEPQTRQQPRQKVLKCTVHEGVAAVSIICPDGTTSKFKKHKRINAYDSWLKGCYQCGLGIGNKADCREDFPEIKWNSSKKKIRKQCN